MVSTISTAMASRIIAYRLSGTWYVRFGSASSVYSSAVSTGVTTDTLIAGKLRGTATAQLLGIYSGTWYVYEWDGSSSFTRNQYRYHHGGQRHESRPRGCGWGRTR